MAGLQGQSGHHYQGNHIDGDARVQLGDTDIQTQIINAVGLTISQYKGSSQSVPFRC